jgi:uncharacterized protein YeaO (DUF488 family)
MAIRVVRLGSPRVGDEGIRIGTARRPPRGIPKSDFARLDFYDVWLPQLAPSEELVKQAREAVDSPTRWRQFEKRYIKELSSPDSQRLINLLIALSKQTNFSIGCYCENEEKCHRSILREVLANQGATII